MLEPILEELTYSPMNLIDPPIIRDEILEAITEVGLHTKEEISVLAARIDREGKAAFESGNDFLINLLKSCDPDDDDESSKKVD